MKTLHPFAPLFLAVAALVAQPVLAQSSPAPITGDKMPTADQLPPKPAKADRKSERVKAREARRPEAEAAAKNQDYSGGVYDPAGKPKPKPKAKPASAP